MEETRTVKDLDTYKKVSFFKKIRLSVYIICVLIAVFVITLDFFHIQKIINILKTPTGIMEQEFLLKNLETIKKQTDGIIIIDIFPRINSDLRIINSIVNQTKECLSEHCFFDSNMDFVSKTNEIKTNYFKTPTEKFIKDIPLTIYSNAAVFKGKEIFTELKNSMKKFGVARVDGDEYDFFGGRLEDFSIYNNNNADINRESVNKQISFIKTEDEKKLIKKYYNTDVDYEKKAWIADTSYVFNNIRDTYGIDTLIKSDASIDNIICGFVSNNISDNCKNFTYDGLFNAIKKGDLYVYTDNVKIRDVFLKNKLQVYPFNQKSKDVFSIHHECLSSVCKKNLSLSYERRMVYEESSLKNTIWIDYENKSSDDITILERIYINPDSIPDVFGIQKEDNKISIISQYDFYNEYGAKVLVFPITISPKSKNTFVFTYNIPNMSPEFVFYPGEFNKSSFYVEFKTARRIENEPFYGDCLDFGSTYVFSGSGHEPVEEMFVLK